MKKYYVFGLLLLLFVLAWIVLVSYINTRTTTLQVQVSGTVEEVLFYQEGHPDELVGSIQTHGKDLSTEVVLHNTVKNGLIFTSPPASYYFISKVGDEIFHSTQVCCSTGVFNQTGYIEITDLHSYQQLHP